MLGSSKILNQIKISGTDTFKTNSGKEIQKAAETTCDLIGNTIVNKFVKKQVCRPQDSDNGYYQKKDRKLLMNFD